MSTSREEMTAMLLDARSHTIALVNDLHPDQLLGRFLEIVNPPLWESGHVGWFQERWTLRELRGETSFLPNADQLYDSAKVAHDTRWTIPLPPFHDTIDYIQRVLERVVDKLKNDSFDEHAVYFHLLSLFHEDMHDEAFVYTRQTLGYRAPAFCRERKSPSVANRVSGDVAFDGGRFLLGAQPGEHEFVFDNEKWAHEVEVAPFRMSRTAASAGEFLDFVENGGYSKASLWSDEGNAWRTATKAHQPVYWSRDDKGDWLERKWNQWIPIDRTSAIVHVNAFEAEAFCEWAGRRLPTEAEWEFAASARGDRKHKFPWGDEPSDESRANLGFTNGGVVDVNAFEAGDTPDGCRQMFGNVWEWTSTRFLPYPGFVADPYKEYSAPWFETPHRVLRGGSWATTARMLRNTWRNFYEPHRRDIFAGFRTCAR